MDLPMVGCVPYYRSCTSDAFVVIQEFLGEAYWLVPIHVEVVSYLSGGAEDAFTLHYFYLCFGPSPLAPPKGGEYNVLPMWPRVGCNYSLPYRGERGLLEDGLNVHLCLVRGAIPIATRGLAGGGVRLVNKKRRVSKLSSLRCGRDSNPRPLA